MADQRDFYQALGVSRTASQDEIQRVYRKLARTYHPDVNKDPEAEERFKEISEAYQVLSDPETRRRYDAFGEDFRRVPEDVDPETWARARAGAGAGARAGGGQWRGGGDAWRDVDLEDVFGDIFGGARGRGWGPAPGADQEAELVLTVEEAYQGGQKKLALSGGRQIDVTIPAGVTNGQRIRLAGQGGRGGSGAPPGDLYLIVRIADHPRYRVEGRNIHATLPITPWEGALGATVSLDTPGGETKVRVPKGTSSGRRLRLRGQGLPNPRGTPGDLFAEVRIMVPSRLTEEEQRLFEELAATSSFDPRRSR
ncbi:DnaJ C-terminal domain-containing protein [Nonomuraea sp. bgisy101]|uniref:DnaJ C-terminal domain-containing protein n=1 Tax=Nonomuraea sp. bgisy101 TaxID=3413784 RepID=UPI003D721886